METEIKIIETLCKLFCNNCKSTIDNGYSIATYINGCPKQMLTSGGVYKFCKCSPTNTHTDISIRMVQIFKIK